MSGENYVRSGIHPELEAEADRIIKESLVGVTRRSEKSDILTPWKEQDRRSREVYNATGVAEPTTRRGIFHRAWNPASPHLNSVAGARMGRGMQRRDNSNGFDSMGADAPAPTRLSIEDAAGNPTEMGVEF